MVGAVLLAAAAAPPAQAQPASICAQVKIEILQKLTFERVAFDARLVVTNNLTTESLTGFGVTLNITTVDGQDASSLFFVKVSSLGNISAADGTGEVPPGVRSEIHWLIVPSAGAGGVAEIGQTYFVGGAVNFATATGPKQLNLFPAPITVRPQPLLDVDYFLPPTVEADDPFTPEVEAPIPFSLGVRVGNHGYGTAGNLHISSGQPKIVENKQGLLIAFRLLGTSVNGEPVQPTLDANFGTIPPQGCGVADWQMVTTLSGRFVSFDAEYTHAPDLGGELTSLIRGTSANVLVHEMLVDLPGRDSIKDFLADTDGDPDHVPDRIFESSCGDFPVNPTAGTTGGIPSLADPNVALSTDVIPGWAFTRVPDPAEGLIPLAQVSRSDGKLLRPENFWISRVQDKVFKTLFHYFVNVIDFEGTGSYTLIYQRPAVDTRPPVTSIVFQAPSSGTNPTFVSPATQILFTATDDISGVASIEYRLDGDPAGFQPAFPFSIPAPGPHVVTFRSTDHAGNREADQSVSVVVVAAPPALAPIAPSPSAIVPSAPAGAPAARQTIVSAAATDPIPDLTGLLEIARGTGDFAALPVVRSIPFTLRSGVPRDLVWDGRNGSGNVVPAGLYTLRITVSEALGHQSQATATVQVNDFVSQQPVAAASNADQEFPDLRGSVVVWQDNRDGNWDIVMFDFAAGTAVNLTSGQPADQQHPRTDGRYIVWQDRRNGNWDIFLYDTTTGTTRPFTTEIADQENPVVQAPWVVWQESRGGQYDIVARNIDTGESVEVSAGDSGAHDQIRPSISGNLIAFEDYRFGLGEIFVYDLAARAERRITDNIDNQTQPTIDGSTVVWVDERNANRDLYMFDLVSGAERRLTFTPTDESQPRLRAGLVAYVDFSAGLADPSIAVYQIATRRALLVTPDPNRQESPALDGDRIVWQDNRTGRWQILSAQLDLATLPIARLLGTGLNLVGITDAEASAHPAAFDLLAAWNGAGGVVEVQKFDPVTGRMLTASIPPGGGAPQGSDFAVAPGDALIARAPASRSLSLAAPVSCTGTTLAAGANYVSLPCVPPGLTARDLIQTFGLAKITSISRYDAFDGRWKAAAVEGGRLVGDDFPIVPGEGYLIYAREPAGPVLP